MNNYLQIPMIKRALTIIAFSIALPAHGMMGRLRMAAGSFQKAVSATALQHIPRATKAQIIVAGGCSIAASGYLTACAVARKEAHTRILESEEAKKRVILLEKNIPSNDSITALFLYYGLERSLHVSKKEPLPSNISELKELFEKYEIIPNKNDYLISKPKPWNDRDWKTTLNELSEHNEPANRRGLYINEVPEFLHDAKLILGSFIPTESELNTLMSDEFFAQRFIEKGGLGRLFTYAQLRQVIQKKKLSHIHLPKKLLVVQERHTGKYIAGQAALKILNDILTVYTAGPQAKIRINYPWDEYDFCIFAEWQPRGRVALSKEALDELALLVEDAPFDIGYDNIFSDHNGDAVIIDTESKGAYTEECLAKLGRYRCS